jgi:hypothetical protein
VNSVRIEPQWLKPGDLFVPGRGAKAPLFHVLQSARIEARPRQARASKKHSRDRF